MLEIKRKILTWWWNLVYKGDCDILWHDDLVDVEDGDRGIKIYHKVGSIKETLRSMDKLGIRTLTREYAEEVLECQPCTECFKNVLPRSIKC